MRSADRPLFTARTIRGRGRRLTVKLALALLVAGPLLSPAQAADPAYVGSEKCRSCHEQAWQSWRESHHYQAMLPASEVSVLGDFSGRTFEYGDVTSRFFRRDGRYWVETDGPDGSLQTYEITHTFGFYPLQQYLVPFPGGRYQALNIVWDSRSGPEGGQRWIHLYPADEGDLVRHDDLVHWTGSFQNWNGRCAACHSTGLRKNYDPASDRFDTRWAEINVACEACHGPASAHLDWANADQSGDDSGIAFPLADRGAFGPGDDPAARVWSRRDGRRPVTQIEACAGCHSRRSELEEAHTGKPFDDLYRLALIEPGLYFPDGQVLDEVYVYGSFLQSKMHAAGVVCTDCHDPHSNKLLADGNALCTRCHVSEAYDRPEHHRHPAGSAGAACVDCHMPSRTYMVVDDRRDHGFRVPEPRLSQQLGVPNSCTQCHADRDAEWAADALQAWGVSDQIRAGHAPILAAAWSDDITALPSLLALGDDESKPAILRASAALASGRFPSQETLVAVAGLLQSENSRVRAAAVQSLDWVPPDRRHSLLRGLVKDRSKAVRHEVARQLAGVPLEVLPPEDSAALASLRREYLQTLRVNADLPEEQMNLALFHASAGDAAAAERAYRKALELAPAFTPALLNLADLYRSNGLDAKARPLLLQAIGQAPGDPAPQHAMGLLLVREKELGAAVGYLRQAAELAPANIRYGYVYAVALWESGERGQAVARLELLLEEHPGNRDLTAALASYYRELGEEEKLQRLTQ
jgi:predicted CXXCH cytochrome family protein